MTEDSTGFLGCLPKSDPTNVDIGTRDGKMGSEWILERLTGGVDWIRLAQDRNLW
jgi:hypothetical protein